MNLFDFLELGTKSECSNSELQGQFLKWVGLEWIELLAAKEF